MLRFVYIIATSIILACIAIYRLSHVAADDRFSEEDRYAEAIRTIKLLKKKGKITTIADGIDNLPDNGGYLMYSNHQGKYDALGIISTHKEPCSLVMDEAKSHTILVSEFVDLLQGKRLIKDNVRQALKIITEVSEDVKNGKKYILFPEGGYEFNNRNRVCDFKAGSFKSAIKAHVPIVPIALIDSYKVFNSFYLWPITTQVHYLEPIYYEEYKDMKSKEIAELVKQRIQDKISSIL